MSTQVGPFEILSEVAKSERGSVYKANDPSDGKTIALKTIRLDMPQEQARSLIERILAEAENTKDLNSQNIALLYGAGEIDGQLCAAMEYVQGRSIATMLTREEGFSIWDLLDISRQVCQALDHARASAVVHYSLEPAKVMVQWDGTVKILSFGISRMGLLEPASSGKAPSILHYFSPEQVSGEPLDERSNLFSWGSILYEMVTDRKAFEGDDVDTVRHKILEQMPVPPVQINNKIHPAISELVMKALSKAPEERFQSGQDLINELEKCKQATTQPTKKSTAPSPKPGHEKASSARKAAAAAAGSGITGSSSGTSARTPRQDGSGQSISSSVEASAESFENQDGKMSAAVTTERRATTPRFAVDPMMAGDAPGTKKRVSFSDLEELPPLKESFLGSPERPTADAVETLQEAPPAVFPGRTKPDKPKLQPRQVAQKALQEIKTVPLKLIIYSISAAVALVVLITIGIGVRIHSQNTTDEGNPAAPASSAAVNADTTPPPNATRTPAQGAALTSVPAQTEAAAGPQVRPVVKPRYRNRKPAVHVPTPVAVVPGQLTVDSTPEGAQVQIDGRSDPGWVTPYNLAGVIPGQHTVSVVKPGYTSETRTVGVASGSKSFLIVHLAPTAATVSLSSQPGGASVFVDGKDAARTTPTQIVVNKGAHTFLLRKQGYLDETTSADFQPGQTFQFAPTLRALGNVDDIKTVGKFKKLFSGGGNAAGAGMVSVKTQPKGAQVTVNRRMLDKNSPMEFVLDPGNYVIDITLSGYKPVHRIVNVDKGNKLVLDEKMERE